MCTTRALEITNCAHPFKISAQGLAILGHSLAIRIVNMWAQAAKPWAWIAKLRALFIKCLHGLIK